MKLDWKMDAAIAGVTALCMGDVAAFMSQANPSIFTMRTFRSDKVSSADSENTKKDIRLGSAVGTVMSAITGIGGALVTGSWYPIAGTIIALFIIVGVYEWALANPHNRRNSIADQ